MVSASLINRFSGPPCSCSVISLQTVRILLFLDPDGRACLDPLEDCGISDDLSDGVDRTCRPDFLSRAHGGWTEKDAEGLSWWPVSKFPSFHLLTGASPQISLYRNRKVDFVAPGIGRPLDGQVLPDQLCGDGIVQLSSHLQCIDNDHDFFGHGSSL